MNTLFQYLEIAVAKEFTGTEDGSMLLLLLAFLNKYSLATCCSHTLGSFFLRSLEKLILS